MTGSAQILATLRARRRRGGVGHTFVVTGALALALASCTRAGLGAQEDGSSAATSAPVQDPSPSAQGEIPSPEQQAKIDAYLVELAQVYGVSDPSEVAMVRMVPASEWEQIQADCMREAGFPMEASVPAEQVEAMRLASYTCNAQYPVNPDQNLGNVTDEQKKKAHDYLTVTLVTCLDGEGHSISDIPSEQSFIEDWDRSGPWNPYDQVSPGLSQEEFQQLDQKCPMNPLAELLWEK